MLAHRPFNKVRFAKRLFRESRISLRDDGANPTSESAIAILVTLADAGTSPDASELTLVRFSFFCSSIRFLVGLFDWSLRLAVASALTQRSQGFDAMVWRRWRRCPIAESRESSELAKQLIETTIEKQNVPGEQLIIHSDRGPSMTSHSVAHLLSSLGVTKSHSRPHVSNDNPFSKSQFKTMKYRPEFPKRFGSYEDGLQFCRGFFRWYNDEHYHSGIGLLTPSSIHYGRAEEITKRSKPDTPQCMGENPRTFRWRHPQNASDSQSSLDQHTEKRCQPKKRSSRGALPRSFRRNVFDAPSIQLSLGRPASPQRRLPFHRTKQRYHPKHL